MRAVSVAVRLSDVDVMPAGGAIGARILSLRFLGEVEFLTLVVQGPPEPVRIRADRLPPGDNDVAITVFIEDILVFEKAS